MIEILNAIRGTLRFVRYLSEKCPGKGLPEAGFIIPRINDDHLMSRSTGKVMFFPVISHKEAKLSPGARLMPKIGDL